MQNIFFKNALNKKDYNEIINMKHYAIDAFITYETNLCDDFIALNDNFASIIVPNNLEKNLEISDFQKGNKDFFLEFEKSGNLKEKEKPFVNEDSFLHLFWNINYPEIVYCDQIKDFKKEYCLSKIDKQLLLSDFQKTQNFKTFFERMRTNSYLQNGNFKKEKDIDKVVRYFNQNVNRFVRTKLKKEKYNLFADEGFQAIEYSLGVSSPKRNFLHALVAQNNLDFLTYFLENNFILIQEIIEKNEENKKKEGVKEFQKLLKLPNIEFELVGINYYNDEIYIDVNGISFALPTNYEYWYEDYDKYDFLEKKDIYKYVNFD